MIIFALVETALESVPAVLRTNPIIVKQAKMRGIRPSNMLLDVSIHHQLIHGLPDHMKRGRPDIVHITLLSILGSPLSKENLIQIFVHTRDDYVIEVDSSTRLPRVYARFTGLMSQLFDKGRVPPSSDKPLLRMVRKNLADLKNQLNPSKTLLFTRIGKRATMEETMHSLSEESKPMIMIGGFPHGTVSKETLRLADETVSIDASMLEAWVVASRAVYEYERAIGLPVRRLA